MIECPDPHAFIIDGIASWSFYIISELPSSVEFLLIVHHYLSKQTPTIMQTS